MSLRPRRSPARNRTTTKNAIKFQIRVYAEGEKTEEVYLTNWHRENRQKVFISIAEHRDSAPLKLVRRAVEDHDRDMIEARKGRGDAYDEYWCVFDVDQHENLPEAVELAAAKGIHVALSSPCIELWFLLHFREQNAYLDRREAQSAAYRALGCNKSTLTQVDAEAMCTSFAIAKQRAIKLSAKHKGDGTPHPWNPSSNLWELLDTIVTAKAVANSGKPFTE